MIGHIHFRHNLYLITQGVLILNEIRKNSYIVCSYIVCIREMGESLLSGKNPGTKFDPQMIHHGSQYVGGKYKQGYRVILNVCIL